MFKNLLRLLDKRVIVEIEVPLWGVFTLAGTVLSFAILLIAMLLNQLKG